MYLFMSFQVLDYTQYYLDLELANKGDPVWQSEYNLTTYYHGLSELSRNEISAVSLHNLADRFTNPEDILFSK
jgi:sphingomyelin phosphodiesterase acid-like 3